MNVVTLSDEAFHHILDKMIEQVKAKLPQQPDKWIDGQEAMRMLRITSKTTLQKFRDEGKIRFSQPEKKILLYDRDSIIAFIEKNARETF